MRGGAVAQRVRVHFVGIGNVHVQQERSGLAILRVLHRPPGSNRPRAGGHAARCLPDSLATKVSRASKACSRNSTYFPALRTWNIGTIGRGVRDDVLPAAVRGDVPGIAAGVFHGAVAITPGPIRGRSERRGARVHGALEDGIHVRHVQNIRRGAGLEFGSRVGEFDHRAGDANFGVHDEIRAGARDAEDFLSAERLFEEVDEIRSAWNQQIGRERAESFADVGHRQSPLRCFVWSWRTARAKAAAKQRSDARLLRRVSCSFAWRSSRCSPNGSANCPERSP